MKVPRRSFLQLTASAAALPALQSIAKGGTYPSRPITLVVFVPAGGAPDISARFVGHLLSQRLGQTVVIENRPGAGGNLALPRRVARFPERRGSTLSFCSWARRMPVNVTLFMKRSKRTSVTPNIRGPRSRPFTLGTFVMLASPSLAQKTVPEFIAYAKVRSRQEVSNLTSSLAPGNLSHLSEQLFQDPMTGIELVHVPYKGAVAGACRDAGRRMCTIYVCDAMTSALPHIRSGKLPALAVTTATRSKALPDVPAVAEFVPGYSVSSWLGVGVPKGTPSDIVDKLNSEINAILADPTTRARFADLGSEPLTGSAAEFGKFIATEADKWGKVIRVTSIKSK